MLQNKPSYDEDYNNFSVFAGVLKGRNDQVCHFQMTDKVFPTDNGMCTVLNANDTHVLRESTKNNYLFKMGEKFGPEGPQGDHKFDAKLDFFDKDPLNATDSIQPIKGTGPNQALIMDLLGPFHPQVIGLGNRYKHFIVS